jgi:hypothetical protein
MVDLPEGLLAAVKSYLKITWQDDATDAEVTGYIKRGMTRLQEIAGASLDFTADDQDYYQLLLDYCRYARSQALEVFEKNFEAELLDLNLSMQAPVIDSLTVIAVPDSSGGYDVTVVPSLDDGDGYVYQVGAGLTLPKRLDTCAPGAAWTVWDGVSPISVTSGQQILVVEINGEYGAERAGTVTV